MSKPYWSGPGTLRGSDSAHYRDDPAHRGYDVATDSARYSTGMRDSYGEYHLDDNFEDDVEDYDEYDTVYEHHDTRWRWVAICAAAVLTVAVAATAVLMYGSDTSTRSSNGPQEGWQELTPSTTPRTVIATVPPETSSPAPIPPETVVTVTTTPSAVAAPPAEAPLQEPPQAVPDTRTITYTVTGSRQLFDLVSVIYTDEQGFPRTDVNVALPWTKQVVLNPGVTVQSVTATSLLGHLNCAITDSAGTPIVVQSNNAMITTCTK
ncbi:MmpS family transport accessory protein [soil metagenome]